MWLLMHAGIKVKLCMYKRLLVLIVYILVKRSFMVPLTKNWPIATDVIRNGVIIGKIKLHCAHCNHIVTQILANIGPILVMGFCLKAPSHYLNHYLNTSGPGCIYLKAIAEEVPKISIRWRRLMITFLTFLIHQGLVDKIRYDGVDTAITKIFKPLDDVEQTPYQWQFTKPAFMRVFSTHTHTCYESNLWISLRVDK